MQSLGHHSDLLNLNLHLSPVPGDLCAHQLEKRWSTAQEAAIYNGLVKMPSAWPEMICS